MADEENAKKLAELPGESYNFKSQDHWGPNGVPQYTSTLENLAEHQLVGFLSLKVGAQVMYTKNNPNHGLVNGSRGVVIGFGPADEDWDDYDTQAKKWDGRNAVPIVKFDNGHVLAISSNYSTIFVGNAQCHMTRRQIPLRLCWALTIHKAQGMSLTRAQVDVSNAFAEGQVYVALSRLVSLNGLWLVGPMFSASNVKAHKSVIQFYSS